MAVELLHVDHCPGHERLLPALRRLSAEAGAELREQRIATAEQACAERFLGSPTVRVDGVDVEPGAERRTDFGLKCRLYLREDGLSNAPAEEWIRESTRAATVIGEPTRCRLERDRLAEPGADQ